MPDFIEVFPKVISIDHCAQIIERFERSGEAVPGRMGIGTVDPELKNSRDIRISGLAPWRDVETLLNNAMLRGLVSYVRRYPYFLIGPFVLRFQKASGEEPTRISGNDIAEMPDGELRKLIASCFRPGWINLQHYSAETGAYAYWHCETYPDETGQGLERVLLWSVYLNDRFENGETEFVFQSRKIVPETGSLLIAPAAFTHTHRGNAPIGQDKYIATSWVLFQRAERLFGSTKS